MNVEKAQNGTPPPPPAGPEMTATEVLDRMVAGLEPMRAGRLAKPIRGLIDWLNEQGLTPETASADAPTRYAQELLAQGVEQSKITQSFIPSFGRWKDACSEAGVDLAMVAPSRRDLNITKRHRVEVPEERVEVEAPPIEDDDGLGPPLPKKKLRLGPTEESVFISLLSDGSGAVPAGQLVRIGEYTAANIAFDGDVETFIQRRIAPKYGPKEGAASWHIEVRGKNGRALSSRSVAIAATPRGEAMPAYAASQSQPINERLLEMTQEVNREKTNLLREQLEREREAKSTSFEIPLSGLPQSAPNNDRLTELLFQQLNREDPVKDALIKRALEPQERKDDTKELMMQMLAESRAQAAALQAQVFELLKEQSKPKENQLESFVKMFEMFKTVKDQVDPPTPPATLGEALMSVGGQLVENLPQILDKFGKMRSEISQWPPREAAAPRMQGGKVLPAVDDFHERVDRNVFGGREITGDTLRVEHERLEKAVKNLLLGPGLAVLKGYQ